MKLSLAAMMTSPGLASAMAARMARLSLGPVSQVMAVPRKTAVGRVDGLDGVVEGTAPVHGIGGLAGLHALEGRELVGGGPFHSRRMVSSGGFSSMCGASPLRSWRFVTLSGRADGGKASWLRKVRMYPD